VAQSFAVTGLGWYFMRENIFDNIKPQ